MQKQKEFIKGITEKRFFFPVVMNLIIMLLLMMFFYSRYNCEIDIFMQTLLYGCGNTMDSVSHLVFMNIILGGILAGLVKLLSGIAWYTVFHYVCVFAAMTVISDFIVRRNKNKLGKTIAVVVSVFLGYECYIIPMYKKTAMILAVASVLLLIVCLIESKRSIAGAVVSIIFGVIGAMISLPVFVYGFLLCMIPTVICILAQRKALKHIRLTLEALVFLFVLVFGVYKLDEGAYATGSGWETAGMQRDVIEQLYVMGFPDYDEIEDALIQNGYVDFDNTKYGRLKNGFFDYTIDNHALLQLIAQQRVQLSPWKILLFFHTVPIKAFKTGMFYLWLILVVLIFYSATRKKAFATTMVSVIMVWIPFFYQYVHYGTNMQWMGILGYMPAIIYLIFNLGQLEASDEENQYAMVYLALTGLVLYYIFAGTLVSGQQDTTELADITALQQEEPEYIHLVDVISYLQRFSIYKPYPKQIDGTNCIIANDLYRMVPGYRNMPEMPLENKLGYKVYTRSEDIRKSVVDNLKLYVSLKGFQKEEMDSFHGMKAYQIVLDVE